MAGISLFPISHSKSLPVRHLTYDMDPHPCVSMPAGMVFKQFVQEDMRELLWNDCWDYEDYCRGPEQSAEEIAWWEEQEYMDFYKS